MDRLNKVVLTAAMIMLVPVWGRLDAVAQNGAPSGRLPSATEAFNLRRKCSILGQELVEGLIVPHTLAKEATSHYNPATNRCYVKVETHTVDYSVPPERREDNEFLYDGQTEDQLLAVLSRGNWHLATIISDSLKKYFREPLNPPYQEAETLIDKFMADDRNP
jgi:hypothetical protein